MKIKLLKGMTYEKISIAQSGVVDLRHFPIR